MSVLADRILQGFAQAYDGAPDCVARAPGRVNLIGEHTDYNDGFALPVAIGVETRVAARRREDGQIHVAALDFGESDSFAPGPNPAKAGGWRDYVRGMVAILERDGVKLPGADLAIAGDIPKGTGLSSSASLEVAVAQAMLALAGVDLPPLRIALLAQAAENDFVGMRCGNLDQIASAATEAGAALLIDCRTLALRPVPLPAGAAIMIVQSGVVRGLVDGEYNARRAECEVAAHLLGVAALRDADLAMLQAKRAIMSDLVYRRARHVIGENARTLAAADALASGDIATTGRLMRESHVAQRDDFGIVVPETDLIATLIDGALAGRGGARQTGGGFGGAVVALLPAVDVDLVRNVIAAEYPSPIGSLLDIRVEAACAGANVMPWLLAAREFD